MSFIKDLRLGLIFVAVSLLIWSVAASLSAAEESTDDYILEETTVTATKMGETNLQETAISITAFDAESIRETNSFNIIDLSLNTPGVNLEPYAGGTLGVIRGVGSRFSGYGGEQNVAFYLDGVYLESGAGANAEFLDVERVEMLRGPQGTLYGRNATAGAVHIISRPPGDEPEGAIELQYGSFSRFRVNATVSGPIVKDKLSARLSVMDSSRDGYVDHPGGSNLWDEDLTSLRSTILFTPKESVSVKLSADYLKNDQNAAVVVRPANNLGLAALFGAAFFDDFWTVKHDAYEFYETETWGLAGHISIDLPGDITLTSITGYRENENDAIMDVDGTEIFLMTQLTQSPSHVEHFSEELQFNGKWRDLDWVVGLYYYTQEFAVKIDVELPFIFPGFANEIDPFTETEAYAAFTQLVYHWSDALSVTAGVRYSYEEKKYKARFANLFTGEIFASDENDWTATTPKFGIDYQLTENHLVYATVSRGFKSGGFNASAVQDPFDPEFIWSYEVGAKTDWFNKRLRLNTSVFFYDYTDLQVWQYTPIGTPIIHNAAQATLKGFELEVTARPLRGLTLNGALSFLDSEYDEFLTNNPATLAPEDVSGNTLPFAPEWTLNAGFRYTIPIGEIAFLTLRCDYIWKDDMYFTEFESKLTKQKAFDLINAGITLETADGKLKLDFFGKNLQETEYWGNLYQFGFTPQGVYGEVTPPRTFGVTLTYTF